MPQGVTATDGHINVGRTVAGAVLTGGLTLLIGGSRSKGKITITYIRTPDWLVNQHMRDIPDQIKTMAFGEEILYADKPLPTRASVVLTRQKIILYTMYFSLWNGKPKDIETIKKYSWSDLKNVSIDIGNIYSDVTFKMAIGDCISIIDLSNDDANKIYAIACEMKGTIADESNDRNPVQTPAIKLRHLKEMLDGGLITQAEYDAKKADLLSRM